MSTLFLYTNYNKYVLNIYMFKYLMTSDLVNGHKIMNLGLLQTGIQNNNSP